MGEEYEDDSVHLFEGHTAGVYAVAWSPASRDLVATGGGDDRAFVWRAGEDALAGNHAAELELAGHGDTVSALAFSGDGGALASGGMDGCVRVWDPSTGACLHVLEGPGEAVEWVRWHPRGKVVLAGAADFTAWMWSAATGACMQVFTGHAGPVTCGGFTPDGKMVVTGGGEGDAALRVWDPKTGECRATVQGLHFHAAGLTSLALHADSAVALTGGEDGSARVVSLEAGRGVGALSGHGEDQSVEAVAFLPGQPLLAATAALDGKLIIWDVATSTARAVCEHPEVSGGRGAAGRRRAWVGGSAGRQWGGEGAGRGACGPRTRHPTKFSPLLLQGITRLACHPTEPLVFSGCIDGAVRCWDARTGACTHTFRGHAEAVQDLAVSPDGSMVLSGSEDGTARVFSLMHP
jgi:ribosome assembly protein SQT1